MIELIKDIKNYIIAQYSYQIVSIEGVKTISMSQPSFVGEGYEQFLIS